MAIGLCLLAACSADDSAPASTTEVPSAPVVLQGDGERSSDLIPLTAGSYSVAYDFTDGCTYYALLESTTDTTFIADLGSGRGPVKGSTNAYGIKGGDYYVKLNTGSSPGCHWTITLTRK